MRTDLRHPFKEGMTLLSTWRNRYSAQEYPEKVFLNMFYKKYTIEFMWTEINNSFQKKLLGGRKILWNDFNTGYQKLKLLYQKYAVEKTQPVLLQLLSDQSDRVVGSITYEDFKGKIMGAQKGSNQNIEEIEYAYLYYYLADECVLLWSAFGGTGMDEIEVIGKMSGMIIEPPEVTSYGVIESILGRLCVAPYLKKEYNPLPPL